MSLSHHHTTYLFIHFLFISFSSVADSKTYTKRPHLSIQGVCASKGISEGTFEAKTSCYAFGGTHGALNILCMAW